MIPFLRVMLALLAILVALPCLALPPPSAVESQRLVKQLGAEEFELREAASKRLEAMGEQVLPVLREAARSTNDPEVRQRVQQVTSILTRPEAKKLEGKWRLVKCEREGRVRDGYTAEFVFNGRRVSRAFRYDNGKDGADKGGFQVFGTGEMDVNFVSGTAYKAIYRLEGDTLLLCFTVRDAKRPDSFEARKGTFATLLTLERQKR
jgi:uncharacterized protein (TIGR03067 family)